MRLLILSCTLLLSVPSFAANYCKAAILKSVLYETRVAELSDDLLNCIAENKNIVSVCTNIQSQLVTIKKDTKKVHLNSNAVCAKELNS